jgi:hypothetical protein
MPCFLLNIYKDFERVCCLHLQVQAVRKGVACLLHPAEGGIMILRNVGKYLLLGTA